MKILQIHNLISMEINRTIRMTKASNKGAVLGRGSVRAIEDVSRGYIERI